MLVSESWLRIATPTAYNTVHATSDSCRNPKLASVARRWSHLVYGHTVHTYTTPEVLGINLDACLIVKVLAFCDALNSLNIHDLSVCNNNTLGTVLPSSDQTTGGQLLGSRIRDPLAR
jgi:hypothetical protein